MPNFFERASAGISSLINDASVRARAVDLDAFLARVSIAETSARTEVAETGTGTPRGRKRRDLARAFDSTR